MEPHMLNMLKLMDQPIFLLCKGAVSWINPAAESLVTMDQRGDSILGAGVELYDQWDRQSMIYTELTLQKTAYTVKICPMESGDLFILRPLSDKADVARKEQIHTSGKLRQILQDLFPACMILQDYMEFDEDLLKEAARVNRSLYRLLRLSNKLSWAEQLFRGEITPYLERTELHRFVGDFAQSLAEVLDDGGWKLSMTPVHGTLYSNIDRELMQQALYYVIAHGVSCSAKGTELVLAVREQGNNIRFDLSYTMDGTTQVEGMEYPDLELVRAIGALHEGALFQFDQGGKDCRIVLSIRKLQPTYPFKEKRHRPNVYGQFHPALVELSDVMESWMYHPDRV